MTEGERHEQQRIELRTNTLAAFRDAVEKVYGPAPGPSHPLITGEYETLQIQYVPIVLEIVEGTSRTRLTVGTTPMLAFEDEFEDEYLEVPE